MRSHFVQTSVFTTDFLAQASQLFDCDEFEEIVRADSIQSAQTD
ncbi:MAG TPA: hypothetical protein V6D48_11970 [Oculatellaceae cyanobacterium]